MTAPRRRTACRISPATGATRPTRRSSVPRNWRTRSSSRPRKPTAFVKSRDEALNGAGLRQTSTTTTRCGRARTTTKGVNSLRTSLVVDPPDGKIPPLDRGGRTAGGSRRRRRPLVAAPTADENRTLAERCITWGNDGPPMMPVGYNANLDILQGPGYVVVRNEMIHSRAPDSDRRASAPRREDPATGAATRAATGTATRSSSRRRTSTTRSRSGIRRRR